MIDINLDDYKYKNPPDFPELFFFRMYIVGSSGSGKTYAMTEFLKKIVEYLDKIYVINPAGDRKVRELGTEVNLYTEYGSSDNATLISIIDHIKGDIDEFKKYIRYKDIYKRFKKLDIPDDTHIPSYLKSVGFESKEVNLLENNNYMSPPYAYDDFDYKVRPPNSLIILDDCVGSSIMKEGRSPLINFFIRSRHAKTNFIVLSQFFKACPKRIRSNFTHFVLFKTYDKSQLMSIFEEINSYLSLDDFLKLFEDNTKEKHSFIVIDLKNQHITKGFNDIIYKFQ